MPRLGLISCWPMRVLLPLKLNGRRTGYAFVLAFEVRGAPDQRAINHFAARISPRLLPWIEMLLTFVVSLIAARPAGVASMVQGTYIEVLSRGCCFTAGSLAPLGWHVGPRVGH